MEFNVSKFDVTKFDGFEVHPCRVVGVDQIRVQEGTRPYELMEQCEPDDPEIAVWSVYGHLSSDSEHLNRGGLEWIADCGTGNIAYLLRDLLREFHAFVSQNPDITSEAEEEEARWLQAKTEEEQAGDEGYTLTGNSWSI